MSSLERFLTRKDIEGLLGLSKSYIYRMISEGEFPRPVHIGSAARWSEREVREWQEAKLNQR